MRRLLTCLILAATLVGFPALSDAQDSSLADAVFGVVDKCTCPAGKTDCGTDSAFVDACATSCADWAATAAGGGNLKELEPLRERRTLVELLALPLLGVGLAFLFLYLAEKKRKLGTGVTLGIWLGIPFALLIVSFPAARPTETVRGALERDYGGIKAMEDNHQAGGDAPAGRMTCSAALTPFAQEGAPWSDTLLAALQRHEGIFLLHDPVPPSMQMDSVTTLDRVDDVIRFYDLIASSVSEQGVDSFTPRGILTASPALRQIYAERVSKIVVLPLSPDPRVRYGFAIPLAWEAALLSHLLVKLLFLVLLPMLLTLLILQLRSRAWRAKFRKN